jgi:hypothetical protein
MRTRPPDAFAGTGHVPRGPRQMPCPLGAYAQYVFRPRNRRRRYSSSRFDHPPRDDRGPHDGVRFVDRGWFGGLPWVTALTLTLLIYFYAHYAFARWKRLGFWSRRFRHDVCGLRLELVTRLRSQEKGCRTWR